VFSTIYYYGVKSRRNTQPGKVALIREIRNVKKIWVGNPKWDSLKVLGVDYLKEKGYAGVE
jgi:hypothetical protein